MSTFFFLLYTTNKKENVFFCGILLRVPFFLLEALFSLFMFVKLKHVRVLKFALK